MKLIVLILISFSIINSSDAQALWGCNGDPCFVEIDVRAKLLPESEMAIKKLIQPRIITDLQQDFIRFGLSAENICAEHGCFEYIEEEVVLLSQLFQDSLADRESAKEGARLIVSRFKIWDKTYLVIDEAHALYPQGKKGILLYEIGMKGKGLQAQRSQDMNRMLELEQSFKTVTENPEYSLYSIQLYADNAVFTINRDLAISGSSKRQYQTKDKKIMKTCGEFCTREFVEK